MIDIFKVGRKIINDSFYDVQARLRNIRISFARALQTLSQLK